MKKLITLFALLTLFAISTWAQMVGANEGKKTSTSTTSSLYKPTGHYLRFEAGFTTIFSVAYGYQINPSIMVGGGIGLGIDEPNVPLYAEVIFSTPKFKWSFYGDIKVGYDLAFIDESSLFIAPSIGVKYKNFGIALGTTWLVFEPEARPNFSIHYDIPL